MTTGAGARRHAAGPHPRAYAEIRAITDSELGAWVQVLDAGFLLPVPDDAVAFRLERWTQGRSLGAFLNGRCAGTIRSLDLEITVPGGALVGAEGLTNIAVLPECRRQGLLNRMMDVGLRGDLAAPYWRAAQPVQRMDRAGGPAVPGSRRHAGGHGPLSRGRALAPR